jgi:hypothetical protein
LGFGWQMAGWRTKEKGGRSALRASMVIVRVRSTAFPLRAWACGTIHVKLCFSVRLSKSGNLTSSDSAPAVRMCHSFVKQFQSSHPLHPPGSAQRSSAVLGLSRPPLSSVPSPIFREVPPLFLGHARKRRGDLDHLLFRDVLHHRIEAQVDCRREAHCDALGRTSHVRQLLNLAHVDLTRRRGAG